MSDLVLIRHGPPEIDPERRATAWPLSNEGRRRVEALAPLLEPYALEVLVASPMLKAFETARILAENLSIPVETDRRLVEHDRRNVEFLGTRAFDASVKEAMGRPDEVVLGAETTAQVRERFTQAIDDILAAWPDVSVGVVSHGTVISLYVAQLTGEDPYQLWRGLGMPAFVVLSRPALDVVLVVPNP